MRLQEALADGPNLLTLRIRAMTGEATFGAVYVPMPDYRRDVLSE